MNNDALIAFWIVGLFAAVFMVAALPQIGVPLIFVAIVFKAAQWAEGPDPEKAKQEAEFLKKIDPYSGLRIDSDD